jgi:hypothetical protein
MNAPPGGQSTIPNLSPSYRIYIRIQLLEPTLSRGEHSGKTPREVHSPWRYRSTEWWTALLPQPDQVLSSSSASIRDSGRPRIE